MPVLAGSDEPVSDDRRGAGRSRDEARLSRHRQGGHGRRRPRHARRSRRRTSCARRSSRRGARPATAFGVADVFLEKFVQHARHIEVQLLGDQHGNLVHLFERDCSSSGGIRRSSRSPRPSNLDAGAARSASCDAALRRRPGRRLSTTPARSSSWSMPTRRVLLHRGQPAHPGRAHRHREVTGYRHRQAQILIAAGAAAARPGDRPGDAGSREPHGFAIQCRVTTEDPANNFLPDYGRLTHYRSASGMGIRLDAGTAFTGAVITPFYDSLLVKVTARGLRFERRGAADGARAAGVPRPRREDEHSVPDQPGHAPGLPRRAGRPRGSSTRRRSCSSFRPRHDRAHEAADVPRRRDRQRASDGPQGPSQARASPRSRSPPVPTPAGRLRTGTASKLLDDGGRRSSPRGSSSRSALLVTDTTFRDAHQSLLATRMRTLRHAARSPTATRSAAPNCSRWRCGAGRRSTRRCGSSRNDPWERLAELRERIPNILFQMLLRAPDASATRTIPDNVVRAFVKESADAGIDVFRIFDALNWLPNMRVAMEAVRERGQLCEAAICYTGDILDPKRTKYDLKYYVELAKELEKSGAHILAIKDMAGLCKPYAAELLVETLKQEVGICRSTSTRTTRRAGRRRARCSRRPRRASISSTARWPAGRAARAAEPERARRGAVDSRERDTGLDLDAAAAARRVLGGGAELYAAVRERDRSRPTRRRLSARDARRAVHEPASTRPRRSAWRDRWHEVVRGVRRGRTGCSATSSR